MKSYFILIVWCCCLFGCKEENAFVRQEWINGHTATIFDIPENSFEHSDTLKLSQFLSSFKIIPLETSAQALVSGNAKYYMGDSCILVFQQENISMFDAQGRFVRVIACQGRAPKEFYRVRDFAVDEKKGLLYVLDYNEQGGIKSYHLKDSAYFKKIQTIEQLEHAAIACLKNGNLLLAPFPHNKVKYACYQQTPEGELGDYALCHSKRTGVHVGMNKLLYTLEGAYRYNSSDNYSDDTVFDIRGSQLIPQWIFNYNNLKYYRLKSETPRLLLFSVNYIKKHEKEVINGGISEHIESMEWNFVYHKENGELNSILSFLDDDLWSHSSRRRSSWNIQDGRKLCLVYSAMELLQLAVSQKEKGIFHKATPEWDELISKLTEEDNPVLLIGDLK